jgi:hypothetical protein
MRHWYIAALALWFSSSGVKAEETRAPDPVEPVDYVQAWLGALDTDDGWSLDQPAPDEDLVGGLGTLPFGGGSAQRLWGQGLLRIGYEGGGLVSWKNDDTKFFAASGSDGGTLVVTTENTFLSVGVFMGGVASLQLRESLRVQVAVGPSLTWARLDLEDDPPDAEDPADSDGTGHDVSFVAYGRAGVEFEFRNGFMLGASVRYADDEFDFGNNGKMEMDEVLWLLTLGSRL